MKKDNPFTFIADNNKLLLSLYLGWHSSLRLAFYARISLAICLALALSSPYWWTVFQMREHVYLDWAFQGYFQAAKHTVALHQLFDRTWGLGTSTIDSSQDTISFQLGALHFILATVGAFLCREVKIFRVVYFLYIALILLMTPFAEMLWANIELFKMIQFPWRLLSVIAVLQVMCAAGLVKLSNYRLVKEKRSLFIFLFLAIVVSWHSNQFIKGPPLDAEKELLLWQSKERFESFENFSGANEYLPKVVPTKIAIRPRVSGSSMLHLEGLGELKSLENNSDYKIRWEVHNLAPAQLRIEQIYFPGWKVLLNGESIAPEELAGNLTEYGMMTIALATPGPFLLEAYYEGPPGWQVRNAIIVIALMAVGGFALWERKTHSNRQ